MDTVVDSAEDPLATEEVAPVMGEALDLGDTVTVSTPVRPYDLAGGTTHGLEEFRFRYYTVDDRLPGFEDNPVLDYQEAVQRLQVVGGNSALTLGAQLDAVALFSNAYKLDGVLTYERDLYTDGMMGFHPNWWFNLEKVWLQGRSGGVDWTVGDSYAAFGRGYALNVVKNTDIDLDTSLRGVNVGLSSGAFELRLVEATTNPQQLRLENPNVSMVPDYAHVVHGVRADYYGRVHAGLHGTAFQFVEGADPTGDGWAGYGQPVGAGIVGGTLEMSSLGPFDVGFEGDYFAYDPSVSDSPGYAGYASLSAYPGMAIVLVEGKISRDTEHVNTFAATHGYELSTGPSLEYERVITEDSSAAVNSNDIKGGRVRVDVNVGKNGAIVTPYLSAAAFRDEDLGGVHFNDTPETIVHGVGGAVVIKGEFHALVNGGYRMDMRDDAPAGNAGDTTAHLDGAVTVPLGHGLSLELAPSILAYHWGNNPIQQADYLDVSNALALKIGAPWAVILYTDYSDNPLINSTGNVTDEVYAAGELQWMPSTATTLKAFYGAYRAGIRCAGGQCRSLPGFDGARVAVTSNF